MSSYEERAPWRRCALVAVGLVVLAASPVSAQTNGDPAAGREVFEANCAMCHGQDASGMMGMHPSLRGAVERLSLEGVVVTVRNGRDTNPPMPAFEGRLSDQEIEDVIAYLDTLPVGPRNFGPGREGMMGGSMDGMMGGGMLVGMIVFLLLIGAVVAAAVLAVRKFGRGSGGNGSRHDDPLSILKERYARGEVDHEEFEERRRVLQQ
ncbi:MAG: c-type cytochrome [Actinomycetota bacterium]|nr:c-type cytochrome [Actinomycetota bacterium]